MGNLENLLDLMGEKKKGDDISPKYLGYVNGDSYETIRMHFRDKKYTAKDTGVSYRVVNNWKEKGVLPDSCIDLKNQEWVKFNLTEIVWIKIVNELRAFGLPLDKIKKIKENLLKWDKKHKVYLSLEYKIFLSISEETDLFLFIEPSGDAFIRTFDFFLSMKNFLNGLNMSFPKILLISMEGLVKEFTHFPDLQTKKVLRVSKPENGLIKKVRSNNEKKFNFEKRDGKIFEMVTLKTNPEKRNFNIKPEINELEKGFYGDVVVHVEDGTIQSSEIRKRKRIKS